METSQKYFPDRGYSAPKKTYRECLNPAFADHRLHRIGFFSKEDYCIERCVNCGRKFGSVYLLKPSEASA